MATDAQSLKIIGAWLARLSKVTTAKAENKLTTETLADLAIMLGKEFPSGAFTSDSLAAVAANHAWFPAYADLRASVEKWWSEHRPQQRRITGPPGADTLADMDARWFAFWYKRIREIEAGHAEDAKGVGLNVFAGRGNAAAARANLASLVRRHSPAAWAIISGSRGERAEMTDAERQSAAEAAGRAVAAMTARQRGVPASASMGEQIAAVKSAMGVTKPLGALTPEQLAAARAGLRKPADATQAARNFVPD